MYGRDYPRASAARSAVDAITGPGARPWSGSRGGQPLVGSGATPRMVPAPPGWATQSQFDVPGILHPQRLIDIRSHLRSAHLGEKIAQIHVDGSTSSPAVRSRWQARTTLAVAVKIAYPGYAYIYLHLPGWL